MQNNVLIVDDERNIRLNLRTLLESENINVYEAGNGSAALTLLKENDIDCLVTDIRMPEMDGMELLRECRTKYPGVPVVMISAHGTVETAVDAMKAGALDFFTKPFNNDEVLSIVKKSLNTRNLDENPKMSTEERTSYNKIVGESPAMCKVYAMLDKVARSDSTVLVTGESGTGKELVAQTIHEKSGRSEKPFIAVNCAALSENLIESELFGHEKGAFTGAVIARPGRFELANEGSLFMDEIGEVSLSVQSKLLRVIQEKNFERVGGIRSIQTDVRLIAATNKNLKEEVEEKRFREDLYYRLNVVPIELPPLRERSGDIALLSNYFIDLFNQRMGRNVGPVPDEVKSCFSAYAWPGNVRELENTIERMMVLSEGDQLEMDTMPEQIRAGEAVEDSGTGSEWLTNKIRMEKNRVERDLLINTLKECNDNRTHAAKKLGVSRKTVQNKIKEFGIG